uniref:Pollen coat oleosin-glycine rich protein n=1 Tax=Olimarabidopsis pumila TaxID=74718 RepID=Q6V5D9_OLIPU|nr:pollen coat oleosin-glycine rich protein [Olimarabidopsis pumila]
MFSFLIVLLEVFQVVIAALASIVFLVLAGLTLASSTAALTITTPLFIIFSPILVPATIATAVLTTGFMAGGALGAMAVALIRRTMGGKGGKPTTGGTSSAQLELPIYGGYGGFWGGRKFSGTFGKPPAGGASPTSGLKGLLGGKPFPGNLPGWLGGLPGAAGGTTPASGGAPAAEASTPEAGAATPAAGAAAAATPPAAGAGAPAAGASAPAAGAATPPAAGASAPAAGAATPPAAGASAPAAGASAPAAGSTPTW